MIELEQDEEEEERAPVRAAPDPGAPTAEEVEHHRATHLPFRSWCEDCVMGRGSGKQHRSGPAGSVPVIACDYLLVTRQGVYMKEELKDTSTNVRKELDGIHMNNQQVQAEVDTLFADTQAKMEFADAGGRRGHQAEDRRYATFRLAHRKDKGVSKLSKGCSLDKIKHWQRCVELRIECFPGWSGCTRVLRQVRLERDEVDVVNVLKMVEKINVDGRLAF